jgi:EAL and modified HD-GYP domain-containing signal transduction protein
MQVILQDSTSTEINPAFAPPCAQIFIGRQPIFDREQRVHAYELLFRSGKVDAAEVTDGDSATAQTLLNGIVNFGLDELVGDRVAFVNLTRRFLLEHHRLPALQERLVLEVLEDITPDAETIGALRQLAARGYTIALDDFTYRTELIPFLEVAQIVKLDLPQIGVDYLPSHVERVRRRGLRLLAEKVETQEEFALCKSLGVDYFQGYFLSRPTTLVSKRLPSNKLAVLQILARLQAPDTTIKDLEKLIGADVSISYRILRFVNSAHFNNIRQIDSVRHAIIMAGLRQIGTMATLIMMSQLLDDKPPELLRIALLRARLCEALSAHLKFTPPEMYATAGLFSTLDALLDRPINEIVESLPLNAELADALITHSGRIGKLLNCALACERGDLSAAAELGIDEYSIGRIWLQAIGCAESDSRLLSGH